MVARVDPVVAQDVLNFRAQVRTPTLRLRIEDAMDALLGPTWRGRFE
jgi:hypothetical protein